MQVLQKSHLNKFKRDKSGAPSGEQNSPSSNHSKTPPQGIMPTKGKCYALDLGFFVLAPLTAGAVATEKITKAFAPLEAILTAVAGPICYLMILGGIILMMLGQRQKGMKMIKDAGFGYLLIQFAPAIMGLLIEISRAMKG